LDAVPDWGTQARVVGQSSVKPAAAGLANGVKVVLPGVSKSAWKWKTL
jgi:hypothetical protein